ncbi:von Willebrand factor A domain-containing protein 5A [Balamuthia mandrillaris]
MSASNMSRSTTGENVCCGLYAAKDSRQPLPLQGLSVRARLVDMVAHVEVTQEFVNDQDTSLEAIWKFQQEQATIYAFSATLDDGRTVHARIKEKEEAADLYEDSLSQGHSAFLLSQDSTSLFQMSLGNLLPARRCRVEFRYVCELPLERGEEDEKDAIRFVLPPFTSLKSALEERSKGTEENKEEETRGGRVEVELEMSSKIVSVESPSHASFMRMEKAEGVEEEMGGRGKVCFGGGKFDLSSPLSLLVKTEEANEPHAVVEMDEEREKKVEEEDEKEERKEVAVMLSFFPKLNGEDMETITEMVFVVDRSGSMAGSRIEQAKNALFLFLQSIPLGTRFNVVGFGSHFTQLFSESVEYNGDTLKKAIAHVKDMAANMGGTSILPPLQSILSTPPDPYYPRQVFVLTDGEVGNTDQVLAYVAANAKSTRVFSFGIGSGASTHLVNGLARAGNGQAEFIGSGERLEAIIMRQLKRALQPVLKQPKVEWGPTLTPCLLRETESSSQPIFDGEKVLHFAFFDGEKLMTAEGREEQLQKIIQEEVYLSAVVDKEGEGRKELRFGLKSANHHASSSERTKVADGMIHRLAARSFIRELMKDKEANKEEIINLGLKYSLVSQFTSFIAVHENEEAVMGSMRSAIISDDRHSPFPSSSSSSFASSRNGPRDIAAIQREIADIQAIMITNIDQVLQRGESIEMCLDRSQDLMMEAGAFKMSAKRMNRPGFLSSVGAALSGIGGAIVNAFSSSSSSAASSNSFASASSSSILPPDSSSSLDSCLGVAPVVQEKKETHRKQLDEDDCKQAQKESITPTSRTTIGKETLYSLVRLQSAFGEWQLDEKLVSHLGVSGGMDKVLDALPNYLSSVAPSLGKTLWATALAVAFLQVYFADCHEEWELLVGKAKKFIRQEWWKLNRDDSFNILLDDAHRFVLSL